MEWEHHARSELGLRRQRNEDALLVDPDCRLFAVADGMGGHAAGDVASALAVATLAAAFPGAPPPGTAATELGRRLQGVFAAAHLALTAQARANPAQAGMGTTLTALAVLEDQPGCVLAHIGDSRAYRLRAGALELLTTDHTWVQEQVQAGMLSPLQAESHPYRSVLTRVLGGGVDPGEADVVLAEAEPGDLFLLCSDGLSGVIGNHDLAVLLAQPRPLPELAEQLVQATLLRGAPDNLTMVLLRPH
jgi:protein phosphatase